MLGSENDLVHFLLAGASFLFASGFFSHLFEASRSFSYLSDMEREMNLRTEQGFYYSFFKQTVSANTVQSAFSDLTHDAASEYGSTINAFERFNIYPEFFAGFAYNTFSQLLELTNLTLKECSEIERENLPPVVACVGLQEPIYFYLSLVWVFAGISPAVLVLYGSLLAESPFGGFLAALCYFFNFAEATRIQWAPALRESFGYPFILIQMYFVARILRSRDKASKLHFVMIFCTTTVAMLFWQFSQFIWLTQVALLFGLAVLCGASSVVRKLLFVHLLSLGVSVCLLFGNRLLLTSPYAAAVVSCLVALVLANDKPSLRNDIVACSVAAVTFILLKAVMTLMFGSGDGGHIWTILISKFTTYKDFHSMLYTCTPEFDFLPVSTVKKLSETLLLPGAYLAFVLLLYNYWKLLDGDKDRDPSAQNQPAEKDGYFINLDLGVLYTVLQTVVFTTMALLIMRLKLFMTPGLCLVASLLASRKICGFLPKHLHWSFIALLVALMSVKGIANMKREYYNIGEYSNPNQEELFNWVKMSTSTDDSFAGAMSIMANLKLSTGRPIVNNPHYENLEMRSRTKRIYQAFGRGSKEELAEDLRQMLADFLVVDSLHCYAKMRPGCGIIDLLEADGKRNHGPVMCEEFFDGDPSPFAVVFQNDDYVVLKVPEDR